MATLTVEVRQSPLGGVRGVVVDGPRRVSAELPGTVADVAVVREAMLRAGGAAHIPDENITRIERGEDTAFTSNVTDMIDCIGTDKEGSVPTEGLAHALSDALMMHPHATRRALIYTSAAGGRGGATPALAGQVSRDTAERMVSQVQDYAAERIDTAAQASAELIARMGETVEDADVFRAQMIFHHGVPFPVAAATVGMTTSTLYAALNGDRQ